MKVRLIKIVERWFGCPLALVALRVPTPQQALAHAGPHGGVDVAPEPHGPSPFTVIASDLANPRDIVIDDDVIYVSEAGNGGDAPCIDSFYGDYHDCYGPSGAIVRIEDGEVERVITGLPSLAGGNGGFAIGATHMTLRNHSLYMAVAHTGDPERRSVFDAADARFGTVLRTSSCGQQRIVADLSAFEDAHNPSGDGQFESNPSGLSAGFFGSLYATDAGANTLLRIDANGRVLRKVYGAKQWDGPDARRLIDEVFRFGAGGRASR